MPPRVADDPGVNFLRRPKPTGPVARETFGAWLLGQFAGGREFDGLPFPEVERLCANAGSLLVGAAYAFPDSFASERTLEAARDAVLIARRTADGFKASLADRDNAVIAWPWDHMATALAWDAAKAGDNSAESLGEALQATGAAYAFRHREQLTAVLELWQQVAAGVHTAAERPDLARMGAEMWAAYQGTLGAAL